MTYEATIRAFKNKERERKTESTIWCRFLTTESVMAHEQVFPTHLVEGGKLLKRSIDFFRRTQQQFPKQENNPKYFFVFNFQLFKIKIDP